MSLGYDVYEDKRSFEEKGITGNVKRYTTTKMDFPCYVIVSSEDNPVEEFKISVLQKMFETVKVYDEEEAKRAIFLYFSDGVRTVKLGRIKPSQVKSFLKLFDANNVDGYYSRDKELVGDYRYVLAE